MVRFIHTADLQIGMKAAHVGAAAEKVRAERLTSAGRIVDAANERNADFVVIAGDTFEDNAVDRLLVQKVADILGKLDCPAYVIPGNHDPLVPGSVWDHSSWQSHDQLRVLRQEEPIEIAGATLYPSPVREKYSPRDPAHWIKAHGSQGIAVGIAHGTVQGVLQDELDYPIRRDAAVRAGLDYLALGHWHSTAEYDADGATRMAYSGTHETTKFGERDSGNVLLVEIDGRGSPPKITRVHTGGLCWERVHEEVHLAGDLPRIRRQIEAKPDADAKKTLLDVRLGGVLYREDQAELLRIDEIVRARFLYGRIDASALVPRPEDDSWLADLPTGLIRDVAGQLRAMADPAATLGRPDYATPEVATRALMELYRMIQETES